MGDTTKEMIDYLEESRARTVHIFFRRGREPKYGMDEKVPGYERTEYGVHEKNSAYITFYSPRAGHPAKAGPNHFRFPLPRQRSLFQEMMAILRLVEAELPNRHVVVNIGWPLSSWLDRLSITVRYINIMRLPRRFPCFEFIMRYMTKVPLGEKKVLSGRKAGEKSRKKTA